MGQTLTHGVYLPDEGERNCYSGLAANWQILDNSVGTIAEHSTQIAGKAPLVHTHVKSDITDFPAYGNTAGTICEGNDSRLSDARTPVAHTHTKSDVTDLLNSNFIPGANNSYDLGSSSYQWNNLYAKNYYYNGVAWGLDKENVWTANNTFSNSIVYFKLGSSDSYSDIRWKDNNDSHYATLRSRVTDLTLGLQYSSASAWYAGASVVIRNDGNVQIKSYDGTENWTVNFTPAGVYPTSDKALELGTSTNQWKSVYAQSYYYNGVAWGLDKQNEWTKSQRITSNPAVWDMKNTAYTLGTAPSGSNRYLGFIFYDSADTDMGRLCVQCHKNGNNYYILGLKNSDGTNTYDGALRYSAPQTNERAFYPEGNTDLGTSTNKWKSLNGINPGALSFPNPDSSKIVDFSTDLNNITKVSETASKFSWTAQITGWMTIVWYTKNITPPHRVAVYSTMSSHDGDGRYNIFGTSFATSVPDYYLFSSFPVVEGVKYWFETSFSNTTAGIVYHAYILPCLGNV